MAGVTTMTGSKRWRWPLLLLITLFALPAWSADTAELEIQGVDKDVRDNIVAYIGEIPLESLKAQRTLKLKLNESMAQAMQSLGYYNANYQFEIRPEKVVISVLPGQPVVIHQFSLVIKGEAEKDADFMAWQKSIPIKVGDVFNQGRYEALKSSLQALATENGYFEAEWVQHEVRVNPETLQADITLVYESGVRYRFGTIRFLQRNGEPQDYLKPQLLQAMLPFKEADAYEADKVIEFNRSLLNVRYFSDVRVQVQREKAENNHVPIDVVLATDKPNHLDFGVGYSTDIKAKISAKWQRPLINIYGHGIEANTELSPVRSSFDSKYTIPLTHPLNDTLQFVYGVKREDAQSVVNWNTVLGAQRQIKKTGAGNTHIHYAGIAIQRKYRIRAPINQIYYCRVSVLIAHGVGEVWIPTGVIVSIIR